MVLVDTPVWSLALRRRTVDLSSSEQHLTRTLYELIRQQTVQLLGSTRQEILSGIRVESQFHKIRDYLRGFPDVDLDSFDYEEAARISNQCRQCGIASSPVDLLMCSVSLRHGWDILTTDHDFVQYARVISLRLFPVPSRE
jgi:predicted nucleic acid-binding protein